MSNRLLTALITSHDSKQTLNQAHTEATMAERNRLTLLLFQISTGAAILPTQRVRLVIATSQFDLFLRCLIPVKSQQIRLGLATVHRIPAKRLVGVIVEIMDAQHCSVTDTTSFKVVGRDRLQILAVGTMSDEQPALANVRLQQD